MSASALASKRTRKIVQLLTAALYNANIGGFASGTLYRGAGKNLCVPGLNCYSCPGAIAACPLGSLQASLGSLPRALPLYVLGFLLLAGGLIGRGVCAFLCPFGLIQELLYKIPTRKHKKNRFTRALSYLKYIILIVFVFALPLYTLSRNGVVSPAFCKWICPAGTLEGALPLMLVDERLFDMTGVLFIWKATVLAAVVVSAVFLYRSFCRFLCPLGAIYSFFNRVAVFGIRVDAQKCIHCDRCVRSCGMDTKIVNDAECIRCGECRAVCPTGALDARRPEWKGVKKCFKGQ
ncbi:MAG: 4Fe-4S binding protein [Christensenellales bacterium]|jgi:ferredoxin-type protein NapH